jgi:methylated-DNA-[protein]-cysteine S-methyltransferase
MPKINIEKFKGTEFQKKVWRALTQIPRGQTITYKKLAKKIGKPKAIRAVANAVGRNPCAPVVPCHRVIRSDGTLGGYSGKGGIKTKIKLLKQEGVKIN